MRLSKTELGQTAFKERSALLSARQRSTFLFVDGKKTLVEVLAMGVHQADVDYLLEMGFLTQLPDESAPVPSGTVVITPATVVAAPAAAPQATAAATASAPTAKSPTLATLQSMQRSEQQRYFDAKPLATQLSASLGLRGFMLNLAVEGAGGYADLVKLLPKLQAALGADACRALERALLE